MEQMQIDQDTYMKRQIFLILTKLSATIYNGANRLERIVFR